MTQLTILSEGQTERDFVHQVLAPHLHSYGYTTVLPILVPDRAGSQGGTGRWHRDKRNILDSLNDPKNDLVTTLVDYYGLNPSWPGRVEARSARATADKAGIVETAVAAAIATEIENLDPERFIPFVTMHEFEALLFSDPALLAASIGLTDQAPAFQAIRDQFPSPEDINDDYHTCPSRRILALAPRYQKRVDGLRVAANLGLETFRGECPHFNDWLTLLEQFPRAVQSHELP